MGEELLGGLQKGPREDLVLWRAVSVASEETV